MEPFFSQRQDHQFTVVEFQIESLMHARDLEQIGGALYRLADDDHRKLVLLDLTKVRFVSSQAVGVLVTMNKKLSNVPGGKLVLCGVGPDIMKLLKITRLDRLLTIRPTQHEALSQE